MRKLRAALLASAWLPCVAAAATWDKVPLVDAHCVSKVKDHPDAHPTSCLLQCADGGYGVMTEGTWVKLDATGNKLAVSELKRTRKKDHIRVDVTGERSGDTIQVTSLKIAD